LKDRESERETDTETLRGRDGKRNRHRDIEWERWEERQTGTYTKTKIYLNGAPL
jgi:hypothetical protein